MSATSRGFLEPGGALRGRLFARLIEEREPLEVLEPGTLVGPWRVASMLGSGGTATVYLAERADGQFEQQVALKLVRPTPRLIDYFRRERQILAELEHPAIARLIDGGELPGGRLWFAMEPVFGDRIDYYVRAHRLALVERVRLFDAVCAAVEYAHSRLLIHRDIKPHNILVDEAGRPRLLDFGIAVSEQSPTLAEDGAMTPSYASPEQLAGDAVTTASDVFQLGLVLRALLAPDGDPCGSLPRPPSRTGRVELAALIARATAPDPGSRYATVAALRADIAAFLERRPLTAVPGRGYRIARLIERQRAPLAVATAAAAALIVLAGIAIDQLRRERDQVIATASSAQAANEFLSSLFAMPDPGRSSSEGAHDLLAQGVERLRQGTGDPAQDAAKALVLADLYLQLNELERSAEVLDAVPAASFDALGPEGPERSRLALARGWLAYSRADYPEAERQYGLAEAAAVAIREPRQRETEQGVLHARRALLFRRLGRLDQALADAQRGVELLEHARGPDDPLSAKAWNGYGLVAKARDDKAAAVEAFTHARDIYTRRYGAGHPLTIGATSNLAETLTFLDRNEEAGALLEDCVSRLSGRDDVHSTQLGLCLDALAQVRIDLGKYAEAAAAAQAADDIYRARLGPDHNYRAFALIHLGDARMRLGQHEAGLAAFEQALALRRSAFGPDHPDVANALTNLGNGHVRAGDAAGALPLLREALGIYVRALPAGNVQVPRTRLSLATALSKLGRREEAEAELSSATRELDAARGALPSDRTRLERLRAEAAALPAA